MAGAVIENLSNRKLFTILASLLGLQILFFLIGALFSPQPSTFMEFLMTKCQDPSGGRSNEWFRIRPYNERCNIIEDLDQYTPRSDTRDIVFVAQMPHARDNRDLEYSPWFQFLLGLLDVEIEFRKDGFDLRPNAPIEFEVRMAYGFKNSKGKIEWSEFISTNIVRNLDCDVYDKTLQEGHRYNCSTLDLFELGANNYPYYLLNIRIPANATRCSLDDNSPNCHIGYVSDMRLIAIHQTGGFTTIWLILKTIIAPVLIYTTYWYWNRVKALNRSQYLIEKSIFALGVSLCILDLPIEWISLWFRLPFMLLISDLRQGLFYAVLFGFWLIFVGEHLHDNPAFNSWKNYWRNLSFIFTTCFCLLIYELGERGMQLRNPFYSLWSTRFGTNLAYFTLYVATICTIAYFIFLCYKIWLVWMTIRRRRSAQLYKMSEKTRLKVEGVIYRFKFLMVFTLVCAGLTIISYYIKQYGEGQMHGDDPEESFLTQSTSAFFTGTFGMWNIYVFLLLALYAPSHKHYANASVLDDENEDLMDSAGTTTSAPMTMFVKPSTD